MADTAATTVARQAFTPGVPALGLRVVMLATDERIDRRIIAEAQALIDEGYDVYLLTAPIGGRGSFEHDGGVPVERVDLVRYAPFLESIGMRAQRKPALHGMASFSLRAYRLARRAATESLDVAARAGVRTPAALSSWALPGYDYAFFRRAVFYRPDIVHVHDLPLLKAGAMVRDATGARLVYDMHEFYPEQVALSERNRRRLRRTEARFIQQTDARFTVNPYLAREIAAAYEVDVDVVQNAVPVPVGLHDSRRDLLRDETGIPRDRPILLYQGWLAPNRNLETMIDAMRLVERAAALVLLGYGDHRAALETRAAGLHDRVFFVDAKDQDELLFYTASADVGLIPYPTGVDVNLTYVSPNKLYEFIAARLPMLSNDLPFVRSVVEPNGFGVVADMDTAERAAAAIDAYPYDELPRFRENLARDGAAWTWEREREKLLEIYRALR